MKLKIIIILAIIIAGVGAYLLFSSSQNKTNKDNSEQTSQSEDAQQTNMSSDSWNKIENNEYGFSFDYPAEWESSKEEIENEVPEGRASAGASLVYSVEFSDENMKKQIACANNEEQNFRSGFNDPGLQECEPVLSDLAEEQKAKLLGPRSEDNIFVRVYKNDSGLSLYNWLVNEFRIPNTELANYEVGEPITLAGLDGYFSSIGCCGGTDRSYTISSGNYVYALGSNHRDNLDDPINAQTMPESFNKAAKSFVLLDTN